MLGMEAMMQWTLPLFLLLCSLLHACGETCPCDLSPSLGLEASLNISLSQLISVCIVSESKYPEVISHAAEWGTEFIYIASNADNNGDLVQDLKCQVVWEDAPIAPMGTSTLWPESCVKVPRLRVPKASLERTVECWQNSANSFDSCSADIAIQGVQRLTSQCPVALQQYLQSFAETSSERTYRGVAFLVSLLAHRKLMECSESFSRQVYAFHHPSVSSVPPHIRVLHNRRRLTMAVVWIGSEDRRSLISRQAQILNHPIVEEAVQKNNLRILPWAATDQLYPCRIDSTRCHGSNKRYRGLLTLSAVNHMSSGWACAQRRPLRAISHILQLWNPQYLVVLDDDTFFNLPLLLKSSMWAQWNQISRPAMMGEMLGRTGPQGHLSRHGMFVGGSGYVLNAALLQRLHGYDLMLSDNGILNPQDAVIEHTGSAVHWQTLSVAVEGMEKAQQFCAPDRQSRVCVPSPENDRSGNVTLGVRVVDFCAELMAGEHTCQHSDHSLGRCVLYAAHAWPVNVVCHDFTSRKSKEKLESPEWESDMFRKHSILEGMSGMCFTAPKCDLTRHLTCHRYGLVADGEWKVEQLAKNTKHGYYKHYSSWRNGTLFDTA